MGSTMSSSASLSEPTCESETNGNTSSNSHSQQHSATESPATNGDHTPHRSQSSHDYIPNKRNKWNFHGDYHNNWEKNLIPINDKMQSDYHISMMATKYWLRTVPQRQTFPEYINIIIAEFYVLPRCSGCGKYDNLWLNVSDGYIGCGRKFYALKSMGGNGCSLTHYKSNNSTKAGPIAVKLGTISANGADVFDYDQPGMIFSAEDDENSKDSDPDDESEQKHKLLSLNELRRMLQKWGIEMNRMYLYDTTFHSTQMVLDDTFSK
eukprot:286125_1